MKRIMFFAVIGLATMINFSSCKDDDPDPEPGNFKVRMTDSPGNYTSLNMTITGVDAYLQNSGWVTLSNQTQTVNVLSLTNGEETQIASKNDMQSGMYTRLKVKFGSTATLNVNATGAGVGINIGLIWSSPQEKEVVIDHQYDNEAGASILLDFDVAESITEVGGQYYLNPSIKEVEDVNTGAKGKVQGTSRAAIVLSNGQNSYSTYMSSSGYFLIRDVEPGTYTLTVYKQSETNQQHEISGIVIVEGQIKDMGTIQL